MRSLSRRQLLKVAAALAGGLVAPGRAAARGPDPLTELLVAIRVDPKQLAIYAELYLSDRPEERDPGFLGRELSASGEGKGGADFKKSLRERIRKDFEAGRTANLDGWILSVSEVRLWCLVHVLSG